MSFKGKNEAEKQGELLSIDLTSRQSSFILHNDAALCSECRGVASYLDGVLFCDAGAFQVKYLNQDGSVDVIAGNS